MKKVLALAVALLSLAPAYAQNQRPPPPPGQGTGMSPPVSSGIPAPPPPPSQWNQNPNPVPAPAPTPDIRRGTLVVVDREAMEARLARLEEMLGAAFERSDRGEGRNKLRKAREALEDVREEIAEAPSLYSSYYPQPQPTPQPPPVEPITNVMLDRLVKAVRNEPFSEDKLRVLGDAAQQYYFTTEQVKNLLPQFRFSREKLQAVQVLWPRVLDRQNGFQLYDAFRFSSDKEALRQIIGG